jgi:hypothetical protein
MDQSVGIHEDIPLLFRSILMLLVELERQAAHAEANRIRSEAVRAYSGAWDMTGKRRLERLEARLRRRLAEGPPPSRPWWRWS